MLFLPTQTLLRPIPPITHHIAYPIAAQVLLDAISVIASRLSHPGAEPWTVEEEGLQLKFSRYIGTPYPVTATLFIQFMTDVPYKTQLWVVTTSITVCTLFQELTALLDAHFGIQHVPVVKAELW